MIILTNKSLSSGLFQFSSNKNTLCWIIMVFLFFSCTKTIGQEINLSQNYGGSRDDAAETIAETSDSGYILGGTSYSSDKDFNKNYGSADIWIIKLNKQKQIDWKKRYGGTNKDRIESIIQTSKGNYVFYGETKSNDKDISSNNGNKDLWVIKLDKNGNIIWKKTYGGSDREASAFDNAIYQTKDGGFILSGTTKSKDGDVGGNNGSKDYWVLKLKNNGDLEWEESFGGSKIDFGRHIRQTFDGGFLVTGRTNSYDGDFSQNSVTPSFGVVKIDSNGKKQWSNTYGTSKNTVGKNFLQSKDSGFLLIGHTKDNNGKRGALAVKIDNKGNLQWRNNSAYGGSDGDWIQGIFKYSTNRYHLVFRSKSDDGDVSGNNGGQDMWFVAIDSTGKIIHEQNFGGSQYDRASELAIGPNGNVFASGVTASNDQDIKSNNGQKDFWFIEFSGFNSYDTLNVDTCDSYLVPSKDEVYSQSGAYIDTLPNNLGYDSLITINLTIGKSSFGKVDTSFCNKFTLPSGNKTLTQSGTYYDTLPNSQRCDSIISFNLNKINLDTTVVKTGTKLIANQTNADYQWIDCDNNYQPVGGATGRKFEPSSNGSYALIISKRGCKDTTNCYNIKSVNLPDRKKSQNFIFYSNPVQHKINLEFKQSLRDADIKLIDIKGNIHWKVENQNGKRFTYNISELANGVYFVRVRSEKFKAKRKVIIQD